MHSQTGEKARFVAAFGPDSVFQIGFAVRVTEHINRAAVAAGDIEPFPVGTEHQAVENLRQRNEPRPPFIEAYQIDTSLRVSRANRNHRFAIRRHDHLQRHVTDADVLTGRRETEAIKQQVGIRREMLTLADCLAVDLFGRKPGRRLGTER